MTTRNKTNLILLLALSLFLTIACTADGETETKTTSTDEVESTSESDEAATTDESDLSDEDSAESETNSGPTTVKFAKGATSRSYKNSISSGESHTYFLGASEGQTMSIKINSPQENAGFTVYDPTGSELSGGEETTEVREFNEELDDSGRYKIVVSSGRNVTYDITFGVSAKSKNLTPDEAAGGANKTVKFGKGKSSATYSNSVIRGEQDTYILGAKAGQFMTVKITSGENNAGFYIVAPNGENLVDDDNNWTGELPADGNYQIVVSGTRGNATYTVKFSVVQSKIRD